MLPTPTGWWSAVAAAAGAGVVALSLGIGPAGPGTVSAGAPVAASAAPAVGGGSSAAAEPAKPGPAVKFKKTVVEAKFRSEGIAVADVDGDGKPDLIAGDVWYQAPDWKVHEIRKPKDYGDGSKGYSESFACFAGDFNKDGRPDVVIIGFPGKEAFWYENPGPAGGHWKQRVAWHSACNETPVWADLFGDGKPVLLMGWQPPKKEREGQMAWFTPASDPELPWEMHAVSEPSSPGKEIPGTFKFYHGLGVGDVNGDGRKDVIIPAGWWEQPAEGRAATKPWKWNAAKLGDACADMFAWDLDLDGKSDVISSAAHRTGIWWHKQLADKPGSFKTNTISTEFSQTHAMHLVDINGDGRPDMITGKRWWAHGPKGDDRPGEPAVLYWIDVLPSADGPKFVFHKIDDDSGVGTQFWVGDLNGDKRPDIAVANKKGVFVFVQE